MYGKRKGVGSHAFWHVLIPFNSSIEIRILWWLSTGTQKDFWCCFRFGKIAAINVVQMKTLD